LVVVMWFDKIQKYEKCESKPVPIYHLYLRKHIIRQAIARFTAWAILFSALACVACLMG